MQPRFTLAALIVLPLTLAACVDGPVVGYRESSRSYSTTELSAASAAGGIAVTALGNPFTGNAPDLSTKVAAAMPRSLSAGATFRPAQEGMKPEYYRVVWLFDPPPALTARQLCQGQTAVQHEYSALPWTTGSRSLATPADSVRAIAAFCGEATPLTSVDGYAAASSPDDPRFRKLVEQITLAMFPLKPEATSNGVR